MTENQHRTESRARLRRVTSPQNPLLSELRKAFSRGELTKNSECAIEGVRTLEEAVRSGLRFRAVFFRASSAGLAERLLPQISAQAEVLQLPDALFDRAVATESPQGVAALVRVKRSKLADAMVVAQPLVVVACGLQDPGNLGTLMRSAEAFGASGVLLAEGTVSAYNPKVVRSSAGSMFRIPVVSVKLAEALPQLRARGLRLVASSSHRGEPLAAADFTGALALFIGGEGAGLLRDVVKQMDLEVRIPHAEHVESLNAGVAASILLYEAMRQRTV